MNILKCIKLLVIGVCTAPLGACSVLYDVVQDRALEDCHRMADSMQRSECLKRNSQSFEQYEQQRARSK